MKTSEHSDIQRLNKVFDHLIENRVASSRKDLASKIGISESMLSLMSNGKKPISDRFYKMLEKTMPEINIEWIKTGEGEMLREMIDASVDDEVMSAVARQQKMIEEANRTLQEMIKSKLNERIIERQMDLIEGYNNELNALVARSMMGSNSLIYRSEIMSYNGATNVKNNYGRRGRRPNSQRGNDE